MAEVSETAEQRYLVFQHPSYNDCKQLRQRLRLAAVLSMFGSAFPWILFGVVWLSSLLPSDQPAHLPSITGIGGFSAIVFLACASLTLCGTLVMHTVRVSIDDNGITSQLPFRHRSVRWDEVVRVQWPGMLGASPLLRTKNSRTRVSTLFLARRDRCLITREIRRRVPIEKQTGWNWHYVTHFRIGKNKIKDRMRPMEPGRALESNEQLRTRRSIDVTCLALVLAMGIIFGILPWVHMPAKASSIPAMTGLVMTGFWLFWRFQIPKSGLAVRRDPLDRVWIRCLVLFPMLWLFLMLLIALGVIRLELAFSGSQAVKDTVAWVHPSLFYLITVLTGCALAAIAWRNLRIARREVEADPDIPTLPQIPPREPHPSDSK